MTRSVVVDVECDQCGNSRPIKVTNQWDYWRALSRPCLACNVSALVGAHDDVDEMAVERLISGSRVNATPAERREAVAYLTRSRLSARVIAHRIGCTKRTVERHRSRVAAQ